MMTLILSLGFWTPTVKATSLVPSTGRVGVDQNRDLTGLQLLSFILHDLIFSLALSTLGIGDVNECPDGYNEDRISRETFKSEA